jgi:hypothetical protein
MSSKTLTTAVQTALDLCRDAYGNGVSGQEERSLRYIALAVEELKATIQFMDSKNDVRQAKALDSLTKSIRMDTHPAYKEFPEMDGTLVSPAMARWKERKLPSDVLRAMSIDTLPPEMQAELAKAKGRGGPVNLTLTPEQAMALFSSEPKES